MRTVSTALMLKVAGFTGPLKEAAAGVKEFGTEFAAASEEGATGFDTLIEGAGIAGAAMLAGFGMAVNAAADFDKQMSSVSAASNATGKDLEALRDAALQAGADTAFSALEAAQAQEELAKAGLESADILGGGLTGALDLAAAGQLEVADAAEIAATAMAQFNLEGEDVGHIADLLAAGANKALGSVGDLGAALRQSGLVASQFGLSIEETVGGLAAFAKEGLLGSDSGTSLKTMLLALANPAKETAALMAKLGINAYDTSGQFVGLDGLAGQLRKSLSGLTQAQRDQAMAQIFGSDAVRAANVLYKNGAEGMRKMTADVNEFGAAGRVAGVEMDNLAGDMEKLQGSIDTALIQTGSNATGVLRVLTQSAGSLVDSFVNAPGFVSATAAAIGLVGGSALTAAAAYGIMAPKVKEASKALVALGAAGAKANTALIATAKWGGIALAAIIGLTLIDTIAEQFEGAAPDVDKLTDSMMEFAESGKVVGEMSRVFTPDVSRLTDAIRIQQKALEHPNAAKVGMWLSSPFDWFSDDSNQDLLKDLQAFDDALAGMVTNGHAREAAMALGEVGLAGKEVSGILPNYATALGKADKAAADAAKSTATAAGQTRVLAGGLAEAVKEAGSLEAALKGLNDVNMTGFEAQNKYQLGINAMTKALKENKGAFKGSSDAAVENRQRVGEQIQMAIEYIGKQGAVVKAKYGDAAANTWASKTYGTLRGQIIGAAVAAGINRAAVTALVDVLFRVPKDTPAAVRAPGAVKAKSEVERLNEEIRRIKDRLARITVAGASHATVEVWALQDALRGLQSKTVWVRFRETHESARTLGVYSHNLKGSGYLGGYRWGGIQTYKAAAGSLREAMVAGPGTRYQWAEPATGGEAFVPRLGNPGRSKAILAEAASWYGGHVAFSGGASMAGAYTAPAMSAGGGGNTYVINQTVSPGADLRKAGQQIVECIQEYENRGGKSWRTR